MSPHGAQLSRFSTPYNASRGLRAFDADARSLVGSSGFPFVGIISLTARRRWEWPRPARADEKYSAPARNIHVAISRRLALGSNVIRREIDAAREQ